MRLPDASIAGTPGCLCPSLKTTAPTLHWMAVPVGQPPESRTTAWNTKASPSLRSFRDGRTSRRAGSPGGTLQSAFVAPAFVSGTGSAVAVAVAVGTSVGAGVAVAVAGGAATTRERDAPRRTSATQLESLMVNS